MLYTRLESSPIKSFHIIKYFQPIELVLFLIFSFHLN